MGRRMAARKARWMRNLARAFASVRVPAEVVLTRDRGARVTQPVWDAFAIVVEALLGLWAVLDLA